MFKVATTGFGAFWSVLTPPADRPTSPIEQPPKLIRMSKSSENLSGRKARGDTLSLMSVPSRQTGLDHQSDLGTGQTINPRPSKQRFRKFMSHLRSSNTRPCPYARIEACEGLAHHCTLCRREIPPSHFYASRPKKIQQDNTITLQYFIDSKGRPRCPICRDYPDLYVACWSLGYIFDKDVGDNDDNECDCGENLAFTCDTCQGRKKLLRDLQNLKLGAAMNVRRGSEKSLQKEVKLFTIIEVEEEEV